VAWTLVVEREAGAVVADRDAAAREVDERQRTRAPAWNRPRLVGGRERVDAEVVLDIGDDQLLMLLFVMEPELHDCLERGDALGIGVEQRRHRLVDVGAIRIHLGDGRAREMAALGPRERMSDALVIRVEQMVVASVERLITAQMRHEHERLEEPRRVCEVPFRRADVGHRLHDVVLRPERRTERFRRAADGPVAREHLSPVFPGWRGATVATPSPVSVSASAAAPPAR
jgi:hypothetical protein